MLWELLVAFFRQWQPECTNKTCVKCIFSLVTTVYLLVLFILFLVLTVVAVVTVMFGDICTYGGTNSRTLLGCHGTITTSVLQVSVGSYEPYLYADVRNSDDATPVTAFDIRHQPRRLHHRHHWRSRSFRWGSRRCFGCCCHHHYCWRFSVGRPRCRTGPHDLLYRLRHQR